MRGADDRHLAPPRAVRHVLGAHDDRRELLDPGDAALDRPRVVERQVVRRAADAGETRRLGLARHDDEQVQPMLANWSTT